MAKNTEKVFITIRQEESIKENGFKIRNTATESWNMPTKIDTKVTGLREKDLAKEPTNIPTGILIQESGRTIPKTVTEFSKWPLAIFTRAIGSMARRTDSVLLFSNVGKYRFTNGDIYEGNFKNGNREGEGIYTWTDNSYYKGEWLNDKMNGYGEYRSATGDVINGLFENDNLVNGEKNKASN